MSLLNETYPAAAAEAMLDAVLRTLAMLLAADDNSKARFQVGTRGRSGTPLIKRETSIT